MGTVLYHYKDCPWEAWQPDCALISPSAVSYRTVLSRCAYDTTDLLRMAVFDALCRNEKRQKEFKGAVVAAGAEGDMPK